LKAKRLKIKVQSHSVKVKTLILFFILAGAVASTPLYAGPIRWEDSYQLALKKATTENKPVMAFFYTNWCTWCSKLISDTFTDSAVIEASRDYICLKIDGEQNRDLVYGYMVKGFPAIFFLDPSGRIIWREFGFRDASTLSGRMAEVVSVYRDSVAIQPYLKKAFEEASRGDTDKAIAIIGEALILYPNDARLYTARGVVYLNKGDIYSALSDFARSLSINPNNYYVYAIRAEAYFMIKDYDKSWEDVKELERRGYSIGPEFLEKLKSASSRSKI
jgi:tetratricopeptide (TPR) repeat protein